MKTLPGSLQIGRATVERVRRRCVRRCVEEGVEAALGRKEQLKTGGRSGWTVKERPTPYPVRGRL